MTGFAGDNLFWRLIQGNPDLGEVARAGHDPVLVLLSVLVAVLGGFAALTIIDRMRVIDRGSSNWWVWQFFGSLTLGMSIWAMHFTGMIAYETPVSIDYDFTITVLSVIPAIIGGGVAIYYMSYRYDQLSTVKILLAALVLALGIGAMHYSGMEAMRMEAHLRYDASLFILSIVVAFVLALLAFYAKFTLVSDDQADAYTISLDMWVFRGIGAALIGFAISGMHYTAMSATRLYPDASLTVDSGMGFPPEVMGFTIGGFGTLYLTGVIIAVQISKNLAVRTIIADQAQALAAGNFDAEVLGRDVGGRLGIAFQEMVTNLRMAANQARTISRGDLEADVLDQTVGGAFGESFERMVDQLTDLIGQLRESIEQLEKTSEEIRSTSDELHGSSKKLTESTRSASESTDQGQEVIEEMYRTMKQINDDSEQIKEAVEMIDEIAGRTKLLSLNASVEAARAGEEGDGFAVVAQEVGELAKQSMNAAESIQETIKNSVRRIDTGEQKAERSQQALAEIQDEIQNVAREMDRISPEDLVDDESPRATSTEQTSSSVEQLLEQAETMERMVEELRSSVEHFQS